MSELDPFYPPSRYYDDDALIPHHGGWRRVWWWPKGLRTPARILEFGTGNGRFQRWAESQGHIVVGFDRNQPMPDFAAKFDVCCAWQTLEHLHRPDRVLEWAFSWLIDGGWLLLSIPNIRSVERVIFGSAWSEWDVPRHLWHFSPTTLRRLVEAAGFRVERIMGQRIMTNVRLGRLGSFLAGGLLAAVGLSSRMTLVARKP